MRVAIATCVHHPLDARIYARQIEALLGAGHDVAYAAPFTATGTPADERLECHDVPRAVGLRRRHAVAMTTAWMRAVSTDVDVLLVHDIELARALCKFPVSAAAVWDVHENNPEAIASRPYLPRMLRPFVRSLARRWEQRAEDSLRLILAETSYLARFTQPHPVVLNLPWVVADQEPLTSGDHAREVVYVGSITQARGVREMVDLASLLEPDGIGVTLIGPADDEYARTLLASSPANLTWLGRLPNAEALNHVRSGLAGLSLLHDLPNFAGSMPTKVLEYLAQGTPVVTTPLPLAAEVVSTMDAGVVVPFADARAAADAVRAIASNPAMRSGMSERGRSGVLKNYNWATASGDFVRLLEDWAAH